MTNLAKEILNDGQTIRPIWNYIHDTFNEIKGKKTGDEDFSFNDRIEFYEHCKEVLDMMIKSVSEVKETSPNEY